MDAGTEMLTSDGLGGEPDGPLCPNCGRSHGPVPACLLGALAGIEADRNGAALTPAELALVDADRFWNEIGGPAVDWLESHVAAQKIERRELSAEMKQAKRKSA